MEIPRVVDPRLFAVDAALIDWTLECQKRGIEFAGGRDVALRWHLNCVCGNLDEHGVDRGIGLPTGPFTVWRRLSSASDAEEQITWFQSESGPFDDGWILRFEKPLAMVRLHIAGEGGPVAGLSSSVLLDSIVTEIEAPAGGPVTVELHAPYLIAVHMPVNSWLLPDEDVSGVPAANYHELDDWKRVEIVGLPVDPNAGDWNFGAHNEPQGLDGDLKDPRTAAAERIARGTPPIGWFAKVAANVKAPDWKPPHPGKLVAEIGDTKLLPALRDALSLEQSAQAAMRISIPVPPPSALDGKEMQAASMPAELSPLMMLGLATGSDPFLSLALGYGTNLPEQAELGYWVTPYHDGSVCDYMVTAPYAAGLDGTSGPVELVAYAPRPVLALPPFAPAHVEVSQRAIVPPAKRDATWGTSNVVLWDRPPVLSVVRVASFAAARHDVGATAPAQPLMEPRPSAGHKPIAPGTAPADSDPESDYNQGNWINFVDRYLPIDNVPGKRTIRYSVATQSLFGLWSPWLGAELTATQPPTPPPRVLVATIAVMPESAQPIDPPSKVCDATLTVDVAYDWTDRAPQQIVLVGCMYAASDLAAPPPVTTAPDGLQRAIDMDGPALELNFSGDGATLGSSQSKPTYVDPTGEKAVTSDEHANQKGGVRRYRVQIGGLQADFSATPHIGMALWARAVERLAPKRSTTAAGPTIVYASDPVAPPAVPQIVPLASLPDADGRSHARIAWKPDAGADGYIVYSSDEATLLDYYEDEASDPNLTPTLAQRSQRLLELWTQTPARRPFTRVNASPVSDTTSLDVQLPRGATGIFAYVIVSTSPGGVEGPWPSGDSAKLKQRIILRAAPRIATPSTPTLTATAKPDGSVALAVAPRAGHRVGRVDVYRVRVDDAARSLDTMGPPIATVGVDSTGWTVEHALAGGAPVKFTGADVPGPSWRRVWYRAVVWAAEQWGQGADAHDIAQHGLIAGRSRPSNAIAVVTPPPGDPNLSEITMSWPDGSLADVQLDWSTLAPLEATTLGGHRLEVVVSVVGDATGQRLITYDGDLAATPSEPPDGGDGLWRVATTPSGMTKFRALVHRETTDIGLDVVVGVIDPIGRISQRTLRVPAVALILAPELAIVALGQRGAIEALQFTTAAPDGFFDGKAYILKVTAVESTASPQPHKGAADVAPASGAQASTRQPAAAAPATPPLAPGPKIAKPPIPVPRPRVHTLETAIGAIALSNGEPSKGQPLEVRRHGGAGPRRQFMVLATVAIETFTLSLTAPDGRVFTVTKAVAR
jgi:hypothetical protein